MPIGAENRPEMMQIGVEIAPKRCKSALILERGRIYANQMGSAQAAKKLSGDALLHDLTISEFLAR